jgi:Zn-dependent protease with chaperone function
MNALSLSPSKRQDAYLLGFLGFFLFILFSLASDLIPAVRDIVHLVIEKCLEKCAALTPVAISAFYGLRSLLVFALPVLFVFAFSKSLSQALRVRAFSRSLTWVNIPPRLKRLLTESDLKPNQVRFFPCSLRFACTVGLFTPKILISTQIVESLTDDEVMAVLRHEQSHLRRRDPLRGVLIVFFAQFFFFLPLARKLMKDSRDDSEVIADHHALARSCPAASLASALIKVRRENIAVVKELDGFAGDDFLGERLSRILNMKTENVVLARRPALIRFMANLAFASFLALLIVPSGKGLPNMLPWHCGHTDHESCCPGEEMGGTRSPCRF